MTKLLAHLSFFAPASVRGALSWRRDTAHVLRAIAAQRYDRRIAGSDSLSLFAVAEPPQLLPAPVLALLDVLLRLAVAAARRTMQRLERHFADVFPAPGEARLAAGLFTSAVALACAGVVGVVSFVGPDPIVGIPHHTGAETASGPTLGAAAAPAVDATAAPAAAPAADPAPAAAPPAPAPVAATPPPGMVIAGEGRGGLPIGKGMWIWLHERAEGGDVNAIVTRARIWGFSHIYVRTATFRDGFMAGAFLDRLLPVAHAANIRVYGWDFPYMNNPQGDIDRAVAAIRHTTPDGHRIDGFAPDIETRSEGTNESVDNVRAYVNGLRAAVGAEYPLIAVIPNPTPGRVARGYPFADIIGPFDAVAPMVYWMNRDSGADVANAISFLYQFGKPIFPIGQAYDGAIDGGPPGIPSRDALTRFMQVSDQLGAVSVSFWSWQHASGDAWNAISDAMEFRLETGPPEALRPMMIRAYQLQLSYLGYNAAPTGEWTPETAAAVLAFQKASGIPETGIVDVATRDQLTRPRAATIRPAGY